MKHIPSGYQVNFSHDLQAERNEQFTSHSYLFYAGWGKCSSLAITLLLIQLWIAQFQTEKKGYTAEIHVSIKCTLNDDFCETFLILCRIKNK